MSVARMLRDWTDQLQIRFAHLHGHQVKALARMSLGMALAEDVRLGKIAEAVAIDAQPDSVRRQMERLLDNPRLPVEQTMQTLATHVLAHWAGRRVDLLLDETPLGNRFRCMKISVAYRGRAVPLAWVCFKPIQCKGRYVQMTLDLLDQVARCMPATARPTLLADRGLSWVSIIDRCEHWGWRYVMRLQHQVKVELDHGEERSVGELVASPDSRWYGSVRAFKTQGWRPVNVAAYHPEQGDPWLLVTNLPARSQRFAQYRRRMYQEESFRDEKSGGLQWQRSRVWQVDHAQHLLLAMALATWHLLSLGSEAVKRGWRRQFGRNQRRRMYSHFRLGIRRLRRALTRGDPIAVHLRLYPTTPIESVG